MKRRYLLSMLSLSVAHIVVALTFMAVTGRFDRLALAVPANLLWLVGVNAAGAHLIFRPIGRFLDSGDGREAALARLRRLVPLSVGWGVCLILPMTTVALFGLGVLCPGCDDPGLDRWLAAQVVIFTVFCAAYLYFQIGDFVSRLRGHLFAAFGIVVEPAGGRLIHKLVVAFVLVGVIPLAMVFLDVYFPGQFRPSSAIGVGASASFYLLISMFMSVAAFVFVQRHLRRPIEALRGAIGSVAAEHVGEKAPVMTDDELGAIARDFNVMVDDLQERQRIRDLFGRYVPEEVARMILANEGGLEPQRREATILFTDIKGFTTLCETMPPESVVTLLNAYFSLLVEIIRRHHGTITQFQGDAVLAAFNVPIHNPDHAADAVRAAVEIQETLAGRTFLGGIALPTRIGINTGTVVSGPVGEGRRLTYTVHGDAVNLAARLEELNKELGTWILVSDETRKKAGDAFAFRPLGEHPIRGKTVQVAAFEVRSRATPPDGA